MTNLVAQRIPTFSNSLLTATSVPSLTISPTVCNSAICPLLQNQRPPLSAGNSSDPFRKSKGDNQLLQFEPSFRISRINESLERARDARRTGDVDSAVGSYRQALEGLRQPFDESSNDPIHSLVPEGNALLTEALIGATALTSEEIFGLKPFASAQPAAKNIEVLSRHVNDLEKADAPKTDLAATKLLLAFNLIQHASSRKVQHDSLFGKAIWIAEGAMSDVAPAMDKAEASEIHFLGGLLVIEALARRLELANRSGDMSEIEKFSDRIALQFNRLYQIHFSPASPAGQRDEFREAYAAYGAFSAVLKYKLGLGAQALTRVRSIVSPNSFENTKAAKLLRKHEFFEGFFDGARFKDAGEVKNNATDGAFLRRLQAAFANAHTTSIVNSMITGGIGMALGIAGAAAAGHPEFGWAAGGLGAAMTEGAYQLRNGWNSIEARDSAAIDTGRISRTRTAYDVTLFMAKRLMSALIWTVPSSAVAAGPEFGETVVNTLANVPGAYEKAFLKLVQSPQNLFPSLLNGDPAETAYQIYTKAAGVIFLANLLSARARKWTQMASFFFIPGAVMFSADIGVALAPPEVFANPMDAWTDRIVRATIVSGEMLVMLLTTGLSPLKNTGAGELRKSFMALGKTLIPIKGNTDYNLPLAAALVTGLSSPLGAMFQVGQMPESYPLIAAQGAAITAGLLGITLGFSGILKRQIPLGANIKRAINDVRHARADEARRIKEGEAIEAKTGMLAYPHEFLRGGLSAFNSGYLRNRVFRILGPDLGASLVRLVAGGGNWDCNAGQTGMSATNAISGNPYWDSAYPSASGAQPEEQSFIRALDKVIGERKALMAQAAGKNLTEKERGELDRKISDALNLFKDHIKKSGQVIHPLHFFMPFKHPLDRLWPLYAFTKPVIPPDFPQRPNPYFFGSVYQVLTDRENLGMDQEKFEVILELVLTNVSDSASYHILRPLVKTLLMAKESETYGDRINSFFSENPHTLIMLNINPDAEELTPPQSPLSRVARSEVRGAIAQPFEKYEARVRRYRRNENYGEPHHLYGLFQAEVGGETIAEDPTAAAPEAEAAKTEIREGEQRHNAEGSDSIPPRVRL
ncbi:MAG: hypothetical protein JXA24_01185 [Proteobacteria bacterium]|nr:hypothetical protein [Pseudomonadota bacterium]